MALTFDRKENKFSFDFQHDNRNDKIHLIGEVNSIDAFGNCCYYSYNFTEEVPADARATFIQNLKFPSPESDNSDQTKFIRKAITILNDKVNLADYNFVIIPQSSSSASQLLLRHLCRFARPSLQYMELINSLPANISFNIDAFEKTYLNCVSLDGQPQYTQEQKEGLKEAIIYMLDLIQKKDYFTINKDERKTKLRPYMMKFLHFQSEADHQLCSAIREQNVLIIDDFMTSADKLNELLCTLRLLNPRNNIVIFSLLGKKSLPMNQN
ncbi:MAG: hypothetical protein MJZ76_03495 [Bacteroidales bacterium]|nr:hypothetical protein [Bacteroidales bacterium]